MKRLLKWLLGIVVSLIVLLLLAILILPQVIDPNDYKDRIESLVADQTGRSFKLEGDIGWSVFPRLALSTGALELGNADGFQEPFFLRAEEASAGVRVWPLLSGNVEAGKIVIRGADIRLEVAENGADNWSTLAGESTADPETSSDSGESAELSIAGLALTDSRVTYRDRSSDLTTTVERINIETGPISADQPLEAEFSLAVALAELAVDAEISGSMKAQHVLAEQQPLIELSRFELDGKYQSLPLSITAEQPVSVDLQQGTLQPTQLSVAAGASNTTLDISGSGLSDQMNLNGKLQFSSDRIKSVMEQAGVAIQTADPDVLSRLQITGDWTFSDQQTAIQGLSIKLDDTSMTGYLTRSSSGINFELAVDQINVDRYTPPEDAGVAEADAEQAAAEGLEVEPIRGKLTIGELIVSGAKLTEINIGVNSNGRQLSLTPLTANLYEGTMSGSIVVKTGARPLDMTTDLSLTGISAGLLLNDFAGSSYMSGNGEMSLNFRLDDILAEQPLSGLNGGLGLKFTDGAIYGFNVMSTLRQASALLGRSEPDAETGELATDFSDLTVDAVFDGGVMRTQVFDLKSPYLRAGGSGSIDLASASMDYTVTPVLVDTPEGQSGAGLDQLKGISLPIKLSGPLGSPDISFDAKAALRRSAGDQLENKLLEKLGAKSDDEEESSSKSLLRGLLKSKLEDKEDDDNGN